ncbi:MAG: hypothetical protein LBL60_01240 [Mycoplasmataceae bacterium]|jgi:6-phosphogluconolactonase/glucosamine-6-phosphate isomerase/deaminase|nr:hypothetical protein [Mycoplasmataceae bacterium]
MFNKNKIIKFYPCCTKENIFDNIAEIVCNIIKTNTNASIGFGCGANFINLFKKITSTLKKQSLNLLDTKIFTLFDYIDLEKKYSSYFTKNVIINNFFKKTKFNTDNIFLIDDKNYIDIDKKINQLRELDLLIIFTTSVGSIMLDDRKKKNTNSAVLYVSENNRSLLVKDYDEKIDVPHKCVSIGFNQIKRAKQVIIISIGSSNSYINNIILRNQINKKYPITLLTKLKNVSLYTDNDSTNLINSEKF